MNSPEENFFFFLISVENLIFQSCPRESSYTNLMDEREESEIGKPTFPAWKIGIIRSHAFDVNKLQIGHENATLWKHEISSHVAHVTVVWKTFVATTSICQPEDEVFVLSTCQPDGKVQCCWKNCSLTKSYFYLSTWVCPLSSGILTQSLTKDRYQHSHTQEFLLLPEWSSQIQRNHSKVLQCEFLTVPFSSFPSSTRVKSALA